MFLSSVSDLELCLETRTMGFFFWEMELERERTVVLVAMVFDGLSGIQLKNLNAFLVRFISVVQSKAIAMKLNPRLSNRSLFKWTKNVSIKVIFNQSSGECPACPDHAAVHEP